MGSYSFNNIHELVTNAYLQSRKNERKEIDQIEFEINQEERIFSIANKLYKYEWDLSPLHWFVLTEPTIREVFSSEFEDSIVSRVLFDIINPIFERYFIEDSYSCRKGKGTLYGIERMEHHIRSVTHNYTQEAWCLNIDISGYFMSIDREILRGIVLHTLEKHKDIIDYNFVEYLVNMFLKRDPLKGCIYHGDPRLQKLVPPSKSLWGQKQGTGIPIGDIINQLFSNIYLNNFDQFIKRTLHIKNYGRYVDDARLLHADKDYLNDCMLWCKDYLFRELGLNIHPQKTRILRIDEGVSFLGAYLLPYRRYVLNKVIKRFKNHITNNELDECKNASYKGYFSHFNSHNIINKINYRQT